MTECLPSTYEALGLIVAPKRARMSPEPKLMWALVPTSPALQPLGRCSQLLLCAGTRGMERNGAKQTGLLGLGPVGGSSEQTAPSLWGGRSSPHPALTIRRETCLAPATDHVSCPQCPRSSWWLKAWARWLPSWDSPWSSPAGPQAPQCPASGVYGAQVLGRVGCCPFPGVGARQSPGGDSREEGQEAPCLPSQNSPPRPQADLCPPCPTSGGCRTAALLRSWPACRWPRRAPRCASTVWSWATRVSSPARPPMMRALRGPKWRCRCTVSHVPGSGGGQPEMPGEWSQRAAAGLGRTGAHLWIAFRAGCPRSPKRCGCERLVSFQPLSTFVICPVQPLGPAPLPSLVPPPAPSC